MRLFNEESSTISYACDHCKPPRPNNHINEQLVTHRRIRQLNLAPKVEAGHLNGVPPRMISTEDSNSCNLPYPERAVAFVKNRFASGCIGTAFEYLGLVSAPPLKESEKKTQLLIPRNDCDSHMIISEGHDVKHNRMKPTLCKPVIEGTGDTNIDLLPILPMKERERISRQSISTNEDVLFSALEKEPDNSIFKRSNTENLEKHWHRKQRVQYITMNEPKSPTNDVRATEQKLRYNYLISPKESTDGINSSLSSISCPSFSDDSEISLDSSEKDEDQESKAIDEMKDEMCDSKSVDSLLSYSESFLNDNVSLSSTMSYDQHDNQKMDPFSFGSENLKQEKILLMLNNLSEENHESINSFDSAISFCPPTIEK